MIDLHRRYRWRGDGPLEGASGEEATGWNKPEGVGEVKSKKIISWENPAEIDRFDISIELSTVSLWEWPYGQ